MGQSVVSDCLQPLSRAWSVACGLTCTICLLQSLFLWREMIQRHSFEYEGKGFKWAV